MVVLTYVNILKVEETDAFETMIPMYMAIERHTPDDRNIKCCLL
jgi:predicted metal-dependent HD superfamily phosphohydrolase